MDVQLHIWGDLLEEALEQLVVYKHVWLHEKACLIQINDEYSSNYGSNIEAKGHDMFSIIFAYLQEWLCVFHETAGFLVKQVLIESLDRLE